MIGLPTVIVVVRIQRGTCIDVDVEVSGLNEPCERKHNV
jgi:hypothetical protein